MKQETAKMQFPVFFVNMRSKAGLFLGILLAGLY